MPPPTSGSPEQLRADARTLAEAGAQVESLAATVLAAAATTRWQSSAADAMRRRVRDEATALRATGAAFAVAASDLQRHAAAIEETLAVLQRIEHAAESVVDALGG